MGIHPNFEIVRDQYNYFIRKDGEVVHGPTNHALAQEKLERLEREAKRKTRKCMTCSASFLSDGPHNRLCNTCRSQSLHDGAV
ncbi:MAG: hypothetical protein ACPGNV_14145 [Mangrovicoccus sp.]